MDLNSTSINIIWDEVDCLNQNGIINKYLVLYHIFETEENTTLEANQTGITVNRLLPRTNYTVQVAPVNSNGTGPVSDEVIHTTKIPDSKNNYLIYVTLLYCYYMFTACFVYITGVFAFLDGSVLENNSIVTLSEIGREDHDALLCYTNLSECCKAKQSNTSKGLGEWLYNQQTIVNRMFSKIGYFISRDLSVVRLHHNISTTDQLPVGIFTCQIPDSNTKIHTIHVGIYPAEEGSLLLIIKRYKINNNHYNYY